jgi:thymidylate synthase (FAD)
MGSFNEVSSRYSVLPYEFYTPEVLRKQSKTNRQGSSEEVLRDIPEWYPGIQSKTVPIREHLTTICGDAYTNYEDLLEAGVAREQSRMLLPVNIYTEFYWTVDLWNLMSFLRLRLDSHAQKEIQEYGQAILSLLKSHVDIPYALEAFQDYVLDAPGVSKYELETIVSALQAHLPDSDEFLKSLELYINDHEVMSNREKKESSIVESIKSIMACATVT